MGFFKNRGKEKGRKLAEEMKNSPEAEALKKQSSELADSTNDSMVKEALAGSMTAIETLDILAETGYGVKYDRDLALKKAKQIEKKEKDRLSKIKNSVKTLLKKQGTKMPASDIDAHLRHQNVDEVKEYCEKMYLDGEISRTGNYRYFVLVEKKKSSTTKAKASEAVDIKSELKKYKEMLDDGLIEQKDYDAKKKELLGL